MESKLNMNILVTGTPGVGKTTFCRLLESMLSEKNLQPTEYIILSTYIIGTPFQNPHNLENKLYKSINEDFNVPEFDEDMVLDELEPKIATGGNIIGILEMFNSI
jgi:adenylate kinase